MPSTKKKPKAARKSPRRSVLQLLVQTPEEQLAGERALWMRRYENLCKVIDRTVSNRKSIVSLAARYMTLYRSDMQLRNVQRRTEAQERRVGDLQLEIARRNIAQARKDAIRDAARKGGLHRGRQQQKKGNSSKLAVWNAERKLRKEGVKSHELNKRISAKVGLSVDRVRKIRMLSSTK